MGSLRLLLGPDVQAQEFGRAVAEVRFHDYDGVVVLASLNVDQYDTPFELDVWKVDFSPVRKLHDDSLQVADLGQ